MCLFISIPQWEIPFRRYREVRGVCREESRQVGKIVRRYSESRGANEGCETRNGAEQGS